VHDCPVVVSAPQAAPAAARDSVASSKQDHRVLAAELELDRMSAPRPARMRRPVRVLPW
jgi:hypothetical protein